MATGNPWGGSDISKWQPEAIFANSMSDFINRLWAMEGAVDVMVSIPLTFLDNAAVRPYGDGQSNARVSFGPFWPHKTVPMRSGLVRKQNGQTSMVFEFSPNLNLSQQTVEISYRTAAGAERRALISAGPTADGWLRGTWDSLPGDFPLAHDPGSELDHMVASGFSFFVRPAPNFNDWFPLTFKHPWTTIAKIAATVPPQLRAFKADSGVANPSDLSDPLNIAQKTDNDPIPFDLAYDLAMQRKWPRAFIPQDIPYFDACNVHGNYKGLSNSHNPSAQEYDPTAVGRNWTWVADPNARYPGNSPYSGAETVPFKILYTCFEERRLHHPTTSDPECSGLSRSSEEETGVPSGGGWHKIGDPAETLFNSLERVPLLVAAGFERPSERLNQFPPSGGYAYQLRDVAVARWLWPGEAFLTANSGKDSMGNEAKNYHWFLFHADREVCTVEWVHPSRPDESKDVTF